MKNLGSWWPSVGQAGPEVGPYWMSSCHLDTLREFLYLRSQRVSLYGCGSAVESLACLSLACVSANWTVLCSVCGSTETCFFMLKLGSLGGFYTLSSAKDPFIFLLFSPQYVRQLGKDMALWHATVPLSWRHQYGAGACLRWNHGTVNSPLNLSPTTQALKKCLLPRVKVVDVSCLS